jgi:hypothetical protein
MLLFKLGFVGGVIIAILIFVVWGAITLFLPRRMHPGFNRAYFGFFDEVMRWIGRAAVLCVVAFVIFMVWLVNFSPYATPNISTLKPEPQASASGHHPGDARRRYLERNDPAPVIPDLSGPPPIDSVPTYNKHQVFIVPGTNAHVSDKFFACKDESDLSRITEIIWEGDIGAATTYAITRDCKVFDVGDYGMVENTGWHSNSCLRTLGKPYCYWFPTKFLLVTAE